MDEIDNMLTKKFNKYSSQKIIVIVTLIDEERKPKKFKTYDKGLKLEFDGVSKSNIETVFATSIFEI